MWPGFSIEKVITQLQLQRKVIFCLSVVVVDLYHLHLIQTSSNVYLYDLVIEVYIQLVVYCAIFSICSSGYRAKHLADMRAVEERTYNAMGGKGFDFLQLGFTCEDNI